MAEESTLKLTFDTNVNKKDADNIDYLSDALERLDKLDLSNLTKLSASLSSLGKISIPNNLGTSINSLVDSIGKLSDLGNIGEIPQHVADSLADGFAKIANATKVFEGSSARIPSGTATIVNAIMSLNGAAISLDSNVGVTMKKGFNAIAEAVKAFDKASMEKIQIPKGLGSEISGLVSAVNMLNEIPDTSLIGDRLSIGFEKIRVALEKFQGFGDLKVAIPKGIGDRVVELANAIRSLENIPDISSQADNLNDGFGTIAIAVSNFEGISAKIPTTLGKGVTELVDAMNKLETVRDISGVANTLNNNFALISQAVSHFETLNNINYAGIAKLVTALTSIGNVKTISNDVIKNAEKLAKAINVLDKNVVADTPRLQAMSGVVRSLGTSFTASSSGVNKFGNSLKLVNFAAFISLARQSVSVMQRLVSSANDAVTQYGELQNAVAFFGQSLGGSTQAVGQQIAEWANLGLVDFSQFSNNVAILTQMLKGYGIAADDAAKMSMNLTQMAYDASYSLGENGKDLEMWLGRTQSLMAGQAKVGYRFGIDTTVKALEENFDDVTNNAAKATKAMAVYETLLRNTTATQGQFSREINTTYVQMSIMKNQMKTMVKSIGMALAPMFLALIKYAMITLKVIALVIDAVVRLFGGKGFELIDYSKVVDGISDSMNDVSGGAKNTADGMKDSTKAAKELKKTISSIDQVFTINDKVDEAASGLSDLSSLGGIGGVSGYDFIDDAMMDQVKKQMDEIDKKAREIFETFKKWLPVITAIGAALLAWKLAKSFISDIKFLDKALGAIELALGGFLLWQGWKWLHDDDPTNDLEGVLLSAFGGLLAADGIRRLIGGKAGVIASRVFTIALGAYLAWEGYRMLTDESPENDLAGALSVMFGFLSIGFSVGSLVFGMAGGLLGASIGLFISITGLKIIFPEQWDNAMKQISDWLNETFNLKTTSGDIEKTIDIASAAFLGLSTLFFLFKSMSKFKAGVFGSDIASKLGDTNTTVETVSQETSTLTSTLKNLVKNLALALVVIVEVAAAAILIVGAIAILGYELQKVGEAWEPVLNGGPDVIFAMLTGTGILLLIGVAMNALGSAGTTLALNMALGAAVLVIIVASTVLFLASILIFGLMLQQIVEAWQPVLKDGEIAGNAIIIGTALLVGIGVIVGALGVAGAAIILALALGIATLALIGVSTALFLAEVLVIGLLLQQVIDAWKPVLDNGDTAEQAIIKGTILLTAVGVAVAALGSITIASAGTLPIAIGLGTAMLVLLAVAFVEFVDSLVKVASSLTNDLMPALVPLVAELPILTSNMEAFADGMIDLAGEFVKYSAASSVAGLAATIDTIVGWFTKDPIKKMVDDVNKQSKNFSDLSSKLSEAVPNLQSSVDYMNTYYSLLQQLKATADNISSMGDFVSVGVQMEAMAISLKNSFATLESIETSNVTNIVNALKQIDMSAFVSIGIDMAKEVENGLNAYVYNFASLGGNVKVALLVATFGIGNETATKLGLEFNTTINAYVFVFTTFGNNVKTSMITSLTGKGTEVGNKICSDVVIAINGYSFNFATAIAKIKAALTFDASDIGKNIANGVQNGINNSNIDISTYEKNVKDKMKDAFDIHSPSKWGENFVGKMLGTGVVNGINETKVDITPFEDNTKNALEGMTDISSSLQPIQVPVDARIDTTKINGDIKATSSQMNANVKSDYDYTADETTDAIYEQTDELVALLNELLQSVKNNSFIIDYKGVSRRITEEQTRDRNIRNVRA